MTDLTPKQPDRIATFRRDCVEALVSNTVDNVHDTGNSLSGVTMQEAAAYHLVDASYDPESVADALGEMADTLYCDGDEFGWQENAAPWWDEESVKTEAVPILRSMTLGNAARDTLQQCSDTLEEG